MRLSDRLDTDLQSELERRSSFPWRQSTIFQFGVRCGIGRYSHRFVHLRLPRRVSDLGLSHKSDEIHYKLHQVLQRSNFSSIFLSAAFVNCPHLHEDLHLSRHVK